MTSRSVREMSASLCRKIFSEKQTDGNKMCCILFPSSKSIYPVSYTHLGIYASGIRGVSLLTKNFQKLRDKRLFVFTVGISDPTDPSRFSPMLEKIFSPEMRKQIRFFHFRGGMDYSKMSFLHRTMMKMLKSMIEKKPLSERTDEDEGILSTFGGKVDFFDENAISPLVEAVEEGSL